ncbi:hypothetical protein FXO38_20559 [Capsicum annuum]|nr:hypothetical protein FXO38_20559 [Capsicum annuum]
MGNTERICHCNNLFLHYVVLEVFGSADEPIGDISQEEFMAHIYHISHINHFVFWSWMDLHWPSKALTKIPTPNNFNIISSVTALLVPPHCPHLELGRFSWPVVCPMVKALGFQDHSSRILLLCRRCKRNHG